jgi:hypothetical protein
MSDGRRKKGLTMNRILTFTILTALLAFVPHEVYGQVDRKAANLGAAEKTQLSQDDPISMGHPLSYWMKVIRDRNTEDSELAFDAIFELGPAARAAVPELTQILAEPFTPIRLGNDSRSAVHKKLLDIHVRAGAVDSLGAIGKAAASAAGPAIQWGMTVRVIAADPPAGRDWFFIELVGVDVLERMRVAGAVARFGIGAAAAVQDLVESLDNERRKFAAAILNDTTVLIATESMQSENCEKRMTGLSLLSGMWPVVSKDHLAVLQETLSCTGLGKEPDTPVTSAGAVQQISH